MMRRAISRCAKMYDTILHNKGEMSRSGAVVHQPCLGQKDETSPQIRIENSGGMCYHKHVFT